MGVLSVERARAVAGVQAATELNKPPITADWMTMRLDATITTHRSRGGAAAYRVTTQSTLRAFGIDDDVLAAWVAAEGDESEHRLPAPGDGYPGSTLSDFVYRALSAGVLVGDPGIELNVHGHDDGAGYSVRLNNVTGGQRLVGLTRGRHELCWAPNHLTPSESSRHYLQQICCMANALLNDLLGPLQLSA